MGNLSIRTRILACVVAVNLLGGLVIAVYLHQTFSGGLDVTAREGIRLSKGAWEDITTHGGEKTDFATLAKNGTALTERMKSITGSDYGLLLAKDAGDQKAYAAIRNAAKLPDNWEEGDTYVVVGATDDALAAKMQIKTTPDSVAEIGKTVGIENGACSKTCHGGVKGSGDFWGVSWSSDSKSRAHAVVPVMDAAGSPIGLLYSVQDITGQADSDRASLIKTMGAIGVDLFVATFIIGFLLDRLVFRRLSRMITSMEDLSVRVAGGDFDAQFEPDGTNDEIGQFEQFFARLLNLMSQTLKSVLQKGA